MTADDNHYPGPDVGSVAAVIFTVAVIFIVLAIGGRVYLALS